jgi:hypothetical protein
LSDTAERSASASPPALSGVQTRGRSDSREVLAGQSADLSWAIQVGANDAGSLHISMTCAYEGVTAASGMCATPLRREQLIGMWISRAPGMPRVLLVWAAPEVSHATVLMTGGDRICVALSPVIEDFRLRFGAAPLPAEHSPARIEIRSWQHGTQVIELWRPPSRLSSGRLGLHLDGSARTLGRAEAAALSRRPSTRILDRHYVTQPGEVVGGRQAGRPCPYHHHPLTRRRRCDGNLSSPAGAPRRRGNAPPS